MTNWTDVGCVADIPVQGARNLQFGGQPVAVFRTVDDRIFALVDRCPHKAGPLSQGIVHGHTVSCPLHNWRIALVSGEAQGDDKGCTPVVPMRLDGDRILLGAPAALADAA
ncbi:nitrite reductase small subunit NirD [Sphingomonas nostoxanthinifaciens]|uniref:nitrite reductase small subunit NirD n=1 Tax=Sphingomonas nostoxanthinifaciens TaxID=2872652 RepID=UPI001CC1DCF4|nr:nitrite reductase small subunit NirD [Sphingomonas nostoxanthinifaciens]UAK23876.1 nitrite reductase small subunit NirD [Sphingomonas nostoxanthinifaciens]